MSSDMLARRGTVVADGLGAVESARVHNGDLWFADWTAGAVCRLDDHGRIHRFASAESAPLAFDWRPDGTIVLLLGAEGTVEILDERGRQQSTIDLRTVSPHPWNDMAVAPDGTAYLGNLGYDFLTDDEFAPGSLVSLNTDGAVRIVAEGLAFPNGIAVSSDGRELLVAESRASRLATFAVAATGDLTTGRRIDAPVGSGPDGICLHSDGTVWFADVARQRTTRIARDGTILEELDSDRAHFACAYRDADATLFVAAASYPEVFESGEGGQILAFRPES